MRVDKKLTRMLANATDLVNTINGGMSVAHVNKFEHPDHYLVTVKVPGVRKDSLKVEIHNNSLFVFQLLHHEGVDIPYLIATLPLSTAVDRTAIRANFHGKHLNIVMPISGDEDHREIQVEDI